MCQMYRKMCACGQKTAELFFGNMVLDESVVAGLYCPDCSAAAEEDPTSSVRDNGWLLVLDEDVMKSYAPRMRLDADTLTAEDVFDADYVTWVGFAPEDNRQRTREREELMKETAGDPLRQFEALKRWAVERERRFFAEGWRKALRGRHAALH